MKAIKSLAEKRQSLFAGRNGDSNASFVENGEARKSSGEARKSIGESRKNKVDLSKLDLDPKEQEMRERLQWQSRAVSSVLTYIEKVPQAFLLLQEAHEQLANVGIYVGNPHAPDTAPVLDRLQEAGSVIAETVALVREPLRTIRGTLQACFDDLNTADHAAIEHSRYKEKLDVLETGQNNVSGSPSAKLARNREKEQWWQQEESVRRARARDLLEACLSREDRLIELARDAVRAMVQAIGKASGCHPTVQDFKFSKKEAASQSLKLDFSIVPGVAVTAEEDQQTGPKNSGYPSQGVSLESILERVQLQEDSAGQQSPASTQMVSRSLADDLEKYGEGNIVSHEDVINPVPSDAPVAQVSNASPSLSPAEVRVQPAERGNQQSQPETSQAPKAQPSLWSEEAPLLVASEKNLGRAPCVEVLAPFGSKSKSAPSVVAPGPSKGSRGVS